MCHSPCGIRIGIEDKGLGIRIENYKQKGIGNEIQQKKENRSMPDSQSLHHSHLTAACPENVQHTDM